MQRAQFEHIIRAATAITGAKEIVIIGSQAVLGQFPNPPAEVLVSVEADLLSISDPSLADLIDGSIGEASPFHQTFGYYAHGVSEDTAVLPPGWKERLIPISNPNTGGGTIHDLAVSKLVAGREKDISYVQALFRHQLADPNTVRARLLATALSPEQRELCQTRLRKLVAD